jgi:hypothetical protein
LRQDEGAGERDGSAGEGELGGLVGEGRDWGLRAPRAGVLAGGEQAQLDGHGLACLLHDPLGSVAAALEGEDGDAGLRGAGGGEGELEAGVVEGDVLESEAFGALLGDVDGAAPTARRIG